MSAASDVYKRQIQSNIFYSNSSKTFIMLIEIFFTRKYFQLLPSTFYYNPQTQVNQLITPISITPNFNHISPKYLCTKLIAMEPSPTAEATRFMAPARTSPAAKIPAQLVSRR